MQEELLVLVHCDMHVMQSTCTCICSSVHIDVSGLFQCQTFFNGPQYERVPYSSPHPQRVYYGTRLKHCKVRQPVGHVTLSHAWRTWLHSLRQSHLAKVVHHLRTTEITPRRMVCGTYLCARGRPVLQSPKWRGACAREHAVHATAAGRPVTTRHMCVSGFQVPIYRTQPKSLSRFEDVNVHNTVRNYSIGMFSWDSPLTINMYRVCLTARIDMQPQCPYEVIRVLCARFELLLVLDFMPYGRQ